MPGIETDDIAASVQRFKVGIGAVHLISNDPGGVAHVGVTAKNHHVRSG